MEACSAAEVAAGSVIERALTTLGCPAKFGDGVVRRARGIRQVHGVLLELKIPCGIETADITQLAQLRNKAAMVQARSTLRRHVGRSESPERWSQPFLGPRHRSDRSFPAQSPPRPALCTRRELDSKSKFFEPFRT
jgi:hypothetical protein